MSTVSFFAWEPPLPLGLAAMRPPYIIEPHGALHDACFKMGRRRTEQLFLRLSLRKDLQQAGCVLVSSRQEQEHLARLLPGVRAVCLPHGVDLPEKDRSDAAQALLAEFPQLRGKRVVLFLGRIHAIKRPELIVEATVLLRKAYPQLMVLMAGPDGGALDVVRAAACRHGLEKALVVTGFLQGDRKEGAFSLAELLVLASTKENFGLVVTEAMAHALPVVVTRGVGSHAYVDESGGGLTVEGHAAALADGIRIVLENDPRAIGQRGRRFVADHLMWPQVMLGGEAIYHQLIDEHARRMARAA